MSKKQRVGYYEQNNVRDKWVLTNSLLPSRPQPLFQSGAKCKVIDMKIFFILMQIKLIFTRKLGFALFLNWYSVWLPSSYCHSEMAWNTIFGWLQGFALKNNTDLTTKERDYMKEKYCKAKYCTMCVTFYKLPSNSFIFDRMSSNAFSLNKIFLRHTLLFISFSWIVTNKTYFLAECHHTHFLKLKLTYCVVSFWSHDLPKSL